MEAEYHGIVLTVSHLTDASVDFIEFTVDINLKSPIDYRVQKNLPKRNQGYKNVLKFQLREESAYERAK